MSKLGLAAIAANATLNEMQRQKEIDYGNATRESDLALLPEREASQRSGYQLQAAQNASSLSLIPAATENKALRFQGDTADRQFDESTRQQREDMSRQELSGKQERLPLQLDTLSKNTSESNINAGISLDSAKADQRNAAQAQANKDYSQHTEAVHAIAQAVAQGDQVSAAKLINGLISATGQAHPEVVKVVRGPHPSNPNDRMIVAVDKDGNMVGSGFPESQLRALANQGKMATIKPGETMVQVSPNGVTPVYTAPDPEGRAVKAGPLERDVNYLVNSHGMSKGQALDRLNTAKTMSRDKFVLDMIKESASGSGRPPSRADIQNFGALYDSATAAASDSTYASKPASAAKSGINFRGFMN